MERAIGVRESGLTRNEGALELAGRGDSGQLRLGLWDRGAMVLARDGPSFPRY